MISRNHRIHTEPGRPSRVVSSTSMAPTKSEGPTRGEAKAWCRGGLFWRVRIVDAEANRGPALWSRLWKAQFSRSTAAVDFLRCSSYTRVRFTRPICAMGARAQIAFLLQREVCMHIQTLQAKQQTIAVSGIKQIGQAKSAGITSRSPRKEVSAACLFIPDNSVLHNGNNSGARIDATQLFGMKFGIRSLHCAFNLSLRVSSAPEWVLLRSGLEKRPVKMACRNS